MNKSLVFLLFSLLWIQHVNAQLSFGIEGGINYSTIDIQRDFNFDVKNSLYFLVNWNIK